MIVLDTATWIRLAVNAGEISATARGYVESASVRYVSAISAWEVALLVARRRMDLDRPVDSWISDAMQETRSTWADVTAPIAALSNHLPAGAPRDPADRMIIATSLALGCALVTPDREMIEYPFAPTIW